MPSHEHDQVAHEEHQPSQQQPTELLEPCVSGTSTLTREWQPSNQQLSRGNVDGQILSSSSSDGVRRRDPIATVDHYVQTERHEMENISTPFDMTSRSSEWKQSTSPAELDSRHLVSTAMLTDEGVSRSVIPMGLVVKSNRVAPVSAPISVSEGIFGDLGDNESSDMKKRERWSNPIEFLLSCIATSVGLGNVWRFPFTAYENGGGVFLLPYFIVLVLIGRPLYFMELVMGQFSAKSAAKVWSMVPAMRGVGYGQIIACASVLSYYTYLIALAIYYLFASFTPQLPWMACHPDLDRPGIVCVDSGNSQISNLPPNVTLISPAEQYFAYGVLKQKMDITDGLGEPSVVLTLCLALCWLLMFFTLWKGVASSGKVAYFTALFPYVGISSVFLSELSVLVALLVRGVTLPGAMTGLRFYLTPNWSALFDFKVWYAAVTQSFFSLSVSIGTLVNFASYNDFRHNIYRDALIISFTDTLTSFLAGLVIFSILGYLAYELNVPVDKVMKSGTGLAFVSYPTALGKFEYAPQVFSALFFFMIITLGLGTTSGLMSGIIAVAYDDFPHIKKMHITAGLCSLGLLCSIVYVTPGGQHMLHLIDFFGGGFIIFALGTLEVLTVHWCYGMQKFIRDIKFMIGIELGIYWKICWGIISPGVLLTILAYALANLGPIEYADQPYPDYALYVGYALIGFACLQVPLWMTIAAFFQHGDTCYEKFSRIWKSSDEWGPVDSKLRLEWIRAEADHVINTSLN